MLMEAKYQDSSQTSYLNKMLCLGQREYETTYYEIPVFKSVVLLSVLLASFPIPFLINQTF